MFLVRSCSSCSLTFSCAENCEVDVDVVVDIVVVAAAVESCVVDVISAGKISSELKSFRNNLVSEGKMLLM